MRRFLPTITSRIFDPLVVFGVLGVMAAFYSLPPTLLARFLVVFSLGMILPPVTLFAWAVKTKRVTNWDVSNRRERVRVLGVLGILLLVDYFLIKTFGNSALLEHYSVFLLWFAGFFTVTLFWKISGHAAAVTLATLVFLRWYGVSWWPVLFGIPLVGWARVVSRNHSLAQVVGGVVYSVLIFLIVE